MFGFGGLLSSCLTIVAAGLGYLWSYHCTRLESICGRFRVGWTFPLIDRICGSTFGEIEEVDEFNVRHREAISSKLIEVGVKEGFKWSKTVPR
jgi:hypothetical protein